jgi:hypothetical protein
MSTRRSCRKCSWKRLSQKLAGVEKDVEMMATFKRTESMADPKGFLKIGMKARRKPAGP